MVSTPECCWMSLMPRAVRADGLRQAVGIFNLLLGALIIVAPHRLDGPMYVGIGPYASALGAADRRRHGTDRRQRAVAVSPARDRRPFHGGDASALAVARILSGV